MHLDHRLTRSPAHCVPPFSRNRRTQAQAGLMYIYICMYIYTILYILYIYYILYTYIYTFIYIYMHLDTGPAYCVPPFPCYRRTQAQAGLPVPRHQRDAHSRHTLGGARYALRSLSLSLSFSAASDRLLAAGEQVGSGTTTSERRGRQEGRRALWP